MEQPTIFEESFGTEVLIRRRSLLPVFLKIYIWAGFVLSGILFLAVLVGLGFWAAQVDFASGSMVSITTFLGLPTLMVGIMFSLTATLWFEVKWAIRYNWIMGGVWLLLLLLIIFAGIAGIFLIMMVLVSIPYWVMIYQIQYRWENESISKRDINMGAF
jgi:hypothetical protein